MIWTHSDLIISQINLRKIKDEVLHCFNETEQYLAMGDELLLTHLDTFGTLNIQKSDFFISGAPGLISIIKWAQLTLNV